MSSKVLIIALLLLFFFVATSASFADLTTIQGQLRDLQLKLIKEKIKLIQEKIYEIGRPKPEMISVSAAPTMSVGELAKSLEAQINALESVVQSLKPRVLDEETARIEQKIAGINQELPAAIGNRLLELQGELQKAAADYQKLQLAVRQALEDSIKYKQAIVLREQIRSVQEKLVVLQAQEFGRSLVPAGAPSAPVSSQTITTPTQVIQAELEKAKLRLIQAQIKAIQEKIQQMKAR